MQINSKPKCPSKPTRTKLVPGRAFTNRLRGNCKITVFGQDTCRGDNLSCCKNKDGDYLCIRPENPSSAAQAPTWEFINPFILHLLEILNPNKDNATQTDDLRCPAAKVEGQGKCEVFEKQCSSNDDCSNNSICCKDPCDADNDPVRVCIPLSLTGVVTRILPPTTDGNSTSKPTTTELTTITANATATTSTQHREGCPKPEYVCVEGECAVSCGAYVGTVICSRDSDCSNGNICCNEPCPGSDFKFCMSPLNSKLQLSNDTETPETVIRNDSDNNAVVVTEITESTTLTSNLCPKAKEVCSENGTNCAVECIDFFPVQFCDVNNSTCSDDTICCPDPCGGPMLCLKPVSSSIVFSQNITGEGNMTTDALIAPEPEPVIGDAMASEFVCPAGDFQSCIGWSEIPGQNGTGLCKTNGDCATGRLCCKITDCGDDVQYCVPHFNKSTLKKGCPIPTWAAQLDAPKCPVTGCTDGKVCCPVDMQGTSACIAPV